MHQRMEGGVSGTGTVKPAGQQEVGGYKLAVVVTRVGQFEVESQLWNMWSSKYWTTGYSMAQVSGPSGLQEQLSIFVCGTSCRQEHTGGGWMGGSRQHSSEHPAQCSETNGCSWGGGSGGGSRLAGQQCSP